MTNSFFFPRSFEMPSTKTTPEVWVGGEKVDGTLDAAPVGVFDVIRVDVRKLSTVQPVEKVVLERCQTGFRGVLYSRGKPYLFAMTSFGFAAKPVDSADAAVFEYCDRLADAERRLTLQRKEAAYSREQQAAAEADVPAPMPVASTTAVIEADVNDKLMTWMPTGPEEDPFVERRPGDVRRVEPKPIKAGVAAGAVVVRGGKLALVKPSNGYGGYDWTFPKGYLEPHELTDESGLQTAAGREVSEELRLSCKMMKRLGTVKYDDGGVCHFYLASVDADDKAKPDGEEIERVKWVSFSEAKELLNNDHDAKVLSWANTAYPRLVFKSETADVVEDQKHTGVMVALYLDGALSDELAVPGGELASSLHITVAYLGKGLSKDTQDRVRAVVRQLAEVSPKLDVLLGGVGRFSASATSEGKDVFYVSVDSPELTKFRQLLVDKLAEEGIAPDTTHGFVPHVTLAYIDPSAKLPVKRFSPVRTVFTKIAVVAGEERTECRFARPKARLKKALPRKSREQREAEQRKDPKPIKAGAKKAGSGGKTRYTYPGEKGGAKKPKPEPQKPQSQPDGPELPKVDQAPIMVPKPNRGPSDTPPQHSVDIEPLLQQLGITKQILVRVVRTFLQPNMRGREGFVDFMQNHLKGFAKKHGLDDDYFGLVFDVVTGAVPPPSAAKPPKAKPTTA